MTGLERSADGGIHATRDSNKRHKCIAKHERKLCRAIQNKRRRMLMPGVVLLYNNVNSYTAAHTRALLQHFNWELFDHPPCRPDPSDQLFTCLNNCLRSQRFNDNKLEGVKKWRSSQAACLPNADLEWHRYTNIKQKGSEAIPVIGRETSRIPHFLNNRLRDGGEVSITRRPPFTPSKIPGIHLC
jgi:hypothetical protein